MLLFASAATEKYILGNSWKHIFNYLNHFYNMKKLFIALAIILPGFLISCTENKTETTETSTAERNKQNMASVYTAIESGDMSAMDSFVADDIVDHGGPGATGRDNVKKMLSDIHNHFSNLKMEMVAEATSGDGNYHFALVRMTGTSTDDKFGMPANMPVDRVSVDVVKLSDGKAVEHWEYEDPKMIMQMMSGDHNMMPMDTAQHKMMEQDSMKKN